MNAIDSGRPDLRSRAVRRLRNLTVGTTILGVAATGAFGWLAAAESSRGDATTATTAATTSTTTADAGTGTATASPTAGASLGTSATPSASTGTAHAATGGS